MPKNQSSKFVLVETTCGQTVHSLDRVCTCNSQKASIFLFRTISRPPEQSWRLAYESYYFWSLLAAGWLLYSSELKVSYREWPLETYYWPLSRWLDVFKELLHSNRIQSRWLYLLLSQESGKNKKTECLFLRWLISFSQDHQKVTCRRKTGSWWQGFKTDFWTRWLKFISFLPYQNSPRWNSK